VQVKAPLVALMAAPAGALIRLKVTALRAWVGPTRSASEATAVKDSGVVLSAVIVAGTPDNTGFWFTSVTVMRIVWDVVTRPSLSVTWNVTEYMPSWASPGVQANAPVFASSVMPGAAPSAMR